MWLDFWSSAIVSLRTVWFWVIRLDWLASSCIGWMLLLVDLDFIRCMCILPSEMNSSH